MHSKRSQNVVAFQLFRCPLFLLAVADVCYSCFSCLGSGYLILLVWVVGTYNTGHEVTSIFHINEFTIPQMINYKDK